MKKKSLSLLIGLILILVAVGVVFASQGNKFGRAGTPPFPQPAEKDLQKVVFIRYAPGFQKDKPCNNNDVCDPGEKGWCGDCKGGGEEEPTPTPEETACYAFLKKSKPRWKWVEDYYWNNLSLATPSSDAVLTWEGVTSGDIFGGGLPGGGSWGVYDLTNSVLFGNYPEAGVIAVTAIWFRGGSIYEYDIMFDTDYFPGNGLVDLDTVALHEFGHGAGLNDLYEGVCVTEVMFGIYDGVDLDLGLGDTTGIQRLYGGV